MIRELWRFKRLKTEAYPVTTTAASASPQGVPIEITKYAQEDVFDRLLIRVSGNVVVAGAAPGTATGAPNPQGLLNSLQLQTQPQYSGIVPFNQVSARTILTDAAFARGYFLNTIETPIPDVAGTHPVDFTVEMYFKRPKVRKGVQWALFLQKYTSVLLNPQFGGREQLFTGGTNTWNLTGLNIQLYTDSDLAVQSTEIHASEIFEQTYTITAAQTDFPIDTLPPGYLYTDFYFQTEVDGVLANTVLNNINIEGGGRVWLPQGDANANMVQRCITRPELNDETQDVTGLYVIPLRDGMFTRAVDALTAPITIKLDVNAPGTTRRVRFGCRRMIPGAVQRMVNPKPSVVRKNVAAH